MEAFMRLFSRLVILLIVFSFTLTPAQALTLHEALMKAENHPALKSHELNIQGRQHEAEDANAVGATSISLSSENLSGSRPGFSHAETSVEIALPISDQRKIRARKKLAESRIELSRIDLASARWLIQSQVQRCFHRALTARVFTEKAEESIENAQKLVEAARVMVDAGAVAEQEILQAELLLRQAEIEFQSMQGKYQDDIAELAIAMGMESLENIRIEGSATVDLELPPAEELELLVMNSHPDIIAKRLEAEEIRAKLGLIRAENLPGWSITAGARNFRDASENDFLIGVTVELPRSRDNRGERRALKCDLERLAAEQDNRLRELHLQLQSAMQKFNRLQEQSKELRDRVLPAAWQLFELSLAGYQLGKTDQIVVLQAQKEFLGQKESYLQKLEELYEAVDFIESLTGPASANKISAGGVSKE